MLAPSLLGTAVSHDPASEPARPLSARRLQNSRINRQPGLRLVH